MKNKIIAHLTIILIFVGVFCNVCTSYNRISFYDSSVYAEADNWTTCDTSDLVTAFRYYCKSRNLAIEGSIADSLTSFTTSTFNNICSTLGIDPTSLSAELKKTTEGNLGLRFLFSNTGITAYNRIFAEFLQNNDLSVGDEVDNKVVYSQNVFVDDDGNTCTPYVINNNNNPNSSNAEIGNSKFVSSGTYYKYSHSDVSSGLNCVFHINGHTYRKTVNSGTGSGEYWRPMGSYFTFNDVYYAFIGAGISDGNICIIYNQYNSHYLLGSIGLRGNMPANNYYHNNFGIYVIADITSDLSDDNLEHSNVTITTNNNTINNNTYNNNYVIIYNDGDTYISDDDDEPLPTTPPSGGGGGGGGDNPTNPDIPPVDPTPTPPPSIPDWDIELPDMPTGNDWLLYGLEKKFPWDIPFNLMYMLSLFAADPETPHFEGTLDLKIVQWDYDIDLAPFDDIAGYVRNIEFIGFLIGLMLLTNKLIWG